MRRIDTSSRSYSSRLAAFCRGSQVPVELAEAVSSILADVRREGDVAVARFAKRFDKVSLKPGSFAIPASELAAAYARIPASERKALKAAHRSIVAFNSRGQSVDWSFVNPQGARVGEKFDPITRVGLYIPGGQVPLVSSVLMSATLASIAGCPQIAAFTPSGPDGKVADGLLAALHLAGVHEVYRIGGVQAIGAMAYGTQSIRAVDKVFGPGNAYVCEAKRQVFGTVGVDSLPGPSEVMVIADGSARADFAAADLLAQAEHGSGREKIYLVSPSARVIDAIEREVSRQLPLLTRAEKTSRVLSEGFLAVKVRSLSEAAAVANYVAPEHLELLVKKAEAKALTRAITTAGAIMIGNYTPTALGDFAAGPSHVLPTGRAGRFFSGLRVADFVRRTSVIEYDQRSVKHGERIVAQFAAMERLDAHGRSARVRVEG